MLNLLITTKRIVVKRTRTILAFWSQTKIVESSESKPHLSGFSRASNNESPREWKRNKRRLAILTKLRLEAFKLIEKLKVGGGKEYFVSQRH